MQFTTWYTLCTHIYICVCVCLCVSNLCVYLPKILSAHAIKHEIYAKICYEERIENVLHNDCCVLRFRCLRLSKRAERNEEMSR